MKIKLLIPAIGIPETLFAEIKEFLSNYVDNECEIDFESLHYGFPSVENELSGMVNGAQAAVQLHENMDEQTQGIIIDCFDDPGVYQCREMLEIPVVGAYQAAIATALQCGERIGIVTTDEPGILNEEKKARESGYASRIASIRALDVSVAEIITDRQKVLKALTKLCVEMASEDRVSCICLGCTAMFSIYEELKENLSQAGVTVSVIEPTANAVLTLQNLIKMGLSTHIPGSVSFEGFSWIQK